MPLDDWAMKRFRIAAIILICWCTSYFPVKAQSDYDWHMGELIPYDSLPPFINLLPSTKSVRILDIEGECGDSGTYCSFDARQDWENHPLYANQYERYWEYDRQGRLRLFQSTAKWLDHDSSVHISTLLFSEEGKLLVETEIDSSAYYGKWIAKDSERNYIYDGQGRLATVDISTNGATVGHLRYSYPSSREMQVYLSSEYFTDTLGSETWYNELGLPIKERHYECEAFFYLFIEHQSMFFFPEIRTTYSSEGLPIEKIMLGGTFPDQDTAIHTIAYDEKGRVTFYSYDVRYDQANKPIYHNDFHFRYSMNLSYQSTSNLPSTIYYEKVDDGKKTTGTGEWVSEPGPNGNPSVIYLLSKENNNPRQIGMSLESKQVITITMW
jgi:hypothetical protein